MAIGREVPGMEGHTRMGATPEDMYRDIQKTRAISAQLQGSSAIPSDTGAAALQDPTAERSPTQTQQVSSMGQPSDLEKVADLTTKAGALNPYVAGAGLALQAISMVDAAKRQEQDQKIKKIMAMREAATRNIFA